MAAKAITHEQLLTLLGGSTTPSPEEFKELIVKLDTHEVLGKVFLLEGVPFVFKDSPMKYVIFREQVAERFAIGSQDVCIVGSAKLGFSPSPYKYGTLFSQSSDVDVVVISEPLFYRGSRALFTVLNDYEPAFHKIRPFLFNEAPSGAKPPEIPLQAWSRTKEAIRNFVYENLNPGLFPNEHPLRQEIFNKISNTAGLFLALEPKVFVSKIRCRIFRNWRAAEDYYTNSLREAKKYFLYHQDVEEDIDDEVSQPPSISTAGPAVAP